MVPHKLHKKELPFGSQTNQELEKIYSGKHIIPYKVSEIESFTTKINNRISDENDESFIKSLYYDINELNDKLNESQSIFKKTFSLMHLNISSLQYHLSYKTRNDLKMYKSNELESVFIEIISKKGKNTIVGCIYKHLKLAIHEFNNQFLSPMLEKVSCKNKEVYLMGDFNINLLNYE